MQPEHRFGFSGHSHAMGPVLIWIRADSRVWLHNHDVFICLICCSFWWLRRDIAERTAIEPIMQTIEKI